MGQRPTVSGPTPAPETPERGLRNVDEHESVYQTLSNLGVNYLIPNRVNSTEREVVETMEADGQAVAVESASVHVEEGSHSVRFLYVPSTKGDGTAIFATNLRVGPDEAETFCRRYSRRWQIYFAFAVLLYNIWRLTDFLLKASVEGEMDYVPCSRLGNALNESVQG